MNNKIINIKKKLAKSRNIVSLLYIELQEELQREKLQKEIALKERINNVRKLRKTMTLQKIGDKMGITRERVRQIENKYNL